jgi:hypothetical protein
VRRREHDGFFSLASPSGDFSSEVTFQQSGHPALRQARAAGCFGFRVRCGKRTDKRPGALQTEAAFSRNDLRQENGDGGSAGSGYDWLRGAEGIGAGTVFFEFVVSNQQLQGRRTDCTLQGFKSGVIGAQLRRKALVLPAGMRLDRPMLERMLGEVSNGDLLRKKQQRREG